jgi:iron complex outermembrane receptor protein
VHALLGLRYTEDNKDLVFTRGGNYVSTVSNARRSVYSNHLDWRVALQWKPVDRTLLYGSATTAFRSANMNNQFIFGSVTAGSALDSLQPVKPENLTAYEAGLKSDFFDRRVRLDAAVFYYDIRNLQYLIFVFDSALGFGNNRLRNIDHAHALGAEFDLIAQLTSRWTMRLGGGFTASQVDSDVSSRDVSGDLISLQGNELPLANPAFRIGADYRIPLGGRGSMSLQADYSWVGDRHFSVNNQAASEGLAYNTTDVRATWYSPTGKYSIEAYGKNIFDRKYFTYAAELYPQTQNVVWGDPAWFGVKFGCKY